MEQLDIIIEPDGTITIKVAGVAGPACTDVTRALEKALGVVTADTPTAEIALAGQRHTVSQR